MGSQGGAVEEGKMQYLCRQSSLSLTLNEVQNQLGDLEKPLGSMNLDELLKSVCTAQDNVELGAWSSSLPQQCSSLVLSRDIQQKKRNDAHKSYERKTQQRQPTLLGEMTLEDFLAEAGVNTELPPINSGDVPHQHDQWMPIQLPSVHQQQQNMTGVFHLSIPVTHAAYTDTQATMSPSSLMGSLLDTQTPGRKRVASGDVVEKTVERRQKRMIKNRESAARSRARKQAYTNELEIKVSQLEEENQRLRRQQWMKQEYKQLRNQDSVGPETVNYHSMCTDDKHLCPVYCSFCSQETEKALPCVAPPEPRHRLRRTASAPL